MIELITGATGTAHVDSEDVGAFNACTIGDGRYLMSGCECTMTTSNNAHIAAGELLLDGRHVRITGTGEDVTITNGTQSNKRNDLICVKYTRTTSGSTVEAATLIVVKGTPTTGTAADPTIAAASILDGDATVFIPLYRITLNGLTVGTPVLLLDQLEAISEMVGIGTWEPITLTKKLSASWTSFSQRCFANKKLGLLFLSFETEGSANQDLAVSAPIAQLPAGFRPSTTVALGNIGKLFKYGSTITFSDFSIRVDSSGNLLAPTYSLTAAGMNVPGVMIPLAALGL